MSSENQGRRKANTLSSIDDIESPRLIESSRTSEQTKELKSAKRQRRDISRGIEAAEGEEEGNSDLSSARYIPQAKKESNEDRTLLMKHRNAVKTKKWRDKQRRQSEKQKEDLIKAEKKIMDLTAENHSLRLKVLELQQAANASLTAFTIPARKVNEVVESSTIAPGMSTATQEFAKSNILGGLLATDHHQQNPILAASKLKFIGNSNEMSSAFQHRSETRILQKHHSPNMPEQVSVPTNPNNSKSAAAAKSLQGVLANEELLAGFDGKLGSDTSSSDFQSLSKSSMQDINFPSNPHARDKRLMHSSGDMSNSTTSLLQNKQLINQPRGMGNVEQTKGASLQLPPALSAEIIQNLRGVPVQPGSAWASHLLLPLQVSSDSTYVLNQLHAMLRNSEEQSHDNILIHNQMLRSRLTADLAHHLLSEQQFFTHVRHPAESTGAWPSISSSVQEHILQELRREMQRKNDLENNQGKGA